MKRWLAVAGLALVGTLIAPPFASANNELDDFLGWKPEKVNVQPSRHVAPGMDSNGFNQSWSSAPKRNPSPAMKRGEASKIGGVFKGANTAVAGLSGFSVGLWAGGHVADFAGLPTTGSLMCDLTIAVFNNRPGCAIGSAPDYVPNFDIMGDYIPPGWNGQPVLTMGAVGPFSSSVATIVNIWKIQRESLKLDIAFDMACGQGSTAGGKSVGAVEIQSYRLSSGGTAGWRGNQITLFCDGTSNIGGVPLGIDKNQDTYQEMKLKDSNGNTVATWFSGEHPDRPEDLSPDPQRAWEISGLCTSGNPFSVSSPWFVESGEWEPLPTMPCDPSAVTVKQLVQGYEDQVMATWETPAEIQQWRQDNPDGSKELDLLRIGGVVEAVSCFSDSTNCTEWWQDPNKNENYQCRFGGQVVALSECNVYRPTFNPLQTVQGVRYADPEGRLPEPKRPLVPETINPGGECFPSGWGVFNPLDWVLKPTKCALSWAFVPKAQTMTSTLQTTKTLLMTKPPFSLVAPVGAVFTGLSEGWGGACTGSLGNFGQGMLIPCSPEDVGIAWTVARHLMTLALVVTTCFVLWRMMVSALGAKGGDA